MTGTYRPPALIEKNRSTLRLKQTSASAPAVLEDAAGSGLWDDERVSSTLQKPKILEPMLALDEHHKNSQWLLHEHLFVAVTCCASCFPFETNMVEETSLVVHLGRNSLPSWGSLPRHAFPLVSLGGACVSFSARAHTRTHGSRCTERPLLFFVQAMYRADDGPGEFTVWSSWRYSSRCFVLCSSGAGLRGRVKIRPGQGRHQ